MVSDGLSVGSVGCRDGGRHRFPMPNELAMGSDLGVAEPELADAPLPFTRLADALRPRRPMTPACTHSQIRRFPNPGVFKSHSLIG